MSTDDFDNDIGNTATDAATPSDDAELADRMLLAVVEAWPNLSATRRQMIVLLL